MATYLGRDNFRRAVFARDKYACVVPSCALPAVDAHHILERKLFPDGGYYLSNGASLCEMHHMEAEKTHLTVEEIRAWADISDPVIPPQLDPNETYDKWGNIILPNGKRLRGELFFDDAVQKILKGVMHHFVQYVKYPRTLHLPWSPGATDDDKVLSDCSHFEGKNVVVTVKMDGENTTMYSDYIHARSLDFSPHPSRTWIKAEHAAKGCDIPEGWRVCGENLYAKHAIHYSNLRSYFQVFSIWDERNQCLPWNETADFVELLGFEPVPVIYQGPWDEKIIKGLHRLKHNGDECEGYVVRLAGGFSYRDFGKSVAKYVRKGHVDPSAKQWLHTAVTPNKLGL